MLYACASGTHIHRFTHASNTSGNRARARAGPFVLVSFAARRAANTHTETTRQIETKYAPYAFVCT